MLFFFDNNYSSKSSQKPIDDILRDLSLFQQTTYCYKYIKKNNKNMSEDDLKINSEFSSAAFRQAFEFYQSAKNASLFTSPLLYSYSLNNFAKGIIYLMDSSLNRYCNKHGLTVNKTEIKSSLLNSLVSTDMSGPATALASLFDFHPVAKQKLTFRSLIDHLPTISDIYYKTTGYPSNTPIKDDNGSYTLDCDDFDSYENNKKESFDKYNIHRSYVDYQNKIFFSLSLQAIELLDENNSRKHFYYKDYMILPINLVEGTYCINIVYYAYVLIMSYGMLVRYHAEKWEKFIDSKISDEATLIRESNIEAVNLFLIHIHMLLFKYTYDYPEIKNEDFSELLQDHSRDIYRLVSKEAEFDLKHNI